MDTKHSITFTKSQWEEIQSVMVSHWESKGLSGNSLAPYTHLDRITEYNVRENEYATNESELEGWTPSDSDKHVIHRGILDLDDCAGAESEASITWVGKS
jgi:hypothetical protein